MTQLEELLEELQHNQKVNQEKGLENRVDIDYIINRLINIKNEVVILEINRKWAGVISRLLVYEIADQENWDEEEHYMNHKMRLSINIEMENLIEQLQKQRIQKHWLYNYTPRQ